MTFNPEGQVIASRTGDGIYYYTVKQGAGRWIVAIPAADLDGLDFVRRRALLTTRVTEAMKGPADE